MSEDRRQKSDARSQRTEVRGRKIEDRCQRTEGRSQMSDVRRQKTGVRGRKTEDRSQMPEVRGQMTEDRRQKSDARSQRTDDGDWKTIIEDMRIEEVREILHAKYAGMELVPIRYADLVFEQRVRLKCFYCKNYGEKWTCPGLAPKMDYQGIISEYANMAVVKNVWKEPLRAKTEQAGDAAEYQREGKEQAGDAAEYQREGKEQDGIAVSYRRVGKELHEALLYMEKELFVRGYPLAVSFIGGYCDWCAEGCAKDKCRHPESARVSWDATGCNVVQSLENIGVQVDFTGKDVCRYGLIAW